MITFRIAHLSDLHFSTVTHRLNPWEAEEAIRQRAAAVMAELRRNRGGNRISQVLYPSTFEPDVAISLLRRLAGELPELDALIVTGDLATTGHSDDMQVARNYFAGSIPIDWDPAAVTPPPSLLENSIPILTLPGNHDRYEGIALIPGALSYERLFGKYWDLDRGHAYSFEESAGGARVRATALQKGSFGLGIVLGDFSLAAASDGEGLTGYIGQGRVAHEILEAMLNATDALRTEASEQEVKSSIIWAIHFAPSFPDTPNTLRLINEQSLLSAAAANGIPLVLCGHTHEPREYVHASTPQVRILCSGSSTGTSVHEHHSYGRIDICLDESGAVASIMPNRFAWNWDTLRFQANHEYPRLT